jgi:predicted ArsR family transcriptional regulator
MDAQIYTRLTLDNSSQVSTANRILFFVKTKGPISTAALAQAFELTPEAARQQVQKLVLAGLMEGVQEEISGAGRPRQNWSLTDAGNQRFPDTHAQLTVQLIGSIRQLFGEDGLDRLIAQRETDSSALYDHARAGRTLPERLRRLAALRTSEGYMARVERDGRDWLLIEDHCPICAAASACQGFCRSELRIFQQVAGDNVTIVREQHLLAGATRCVYRISARSSVHP